MLKRKASLVVATATVLAVSACGSATRYANNPRPPDLVVIAAAVTNDRVAVSPARIGAGPVEFTLANETGASQTVTLASDQVGQLQLQTPPINPGDTASLKTVLKTGSYSVRVEGSTIRASRVAVGPSRPSAQNTLIEP